MTTATTQQATCRRCGRRLTSPASVTRRYGAWCARLAWADEHAATRAQFTADQNNGADEILELGALVPVAAGVYVTVGTNGDRYDTTAYACNCPARRACKHMLAARLTDLRARYLDPPAPSTSTTQPARRAA